MHETQVQITNHIPQVAECYLILPLVAIYMHVARKRLKFIDKSYLKDVNFFIATQKNADEPTEEEVEEDPEEEDYIEEVQ